MTQLARLYLVTHTTQVPLPPPPGSKAKPSPGLCFEMDLLFALFEKQVRHCASPPSETLAQCAHQMEALLTRARRQGRDTSLTWPAAARAEAEAVLTSCLRLAAVLARHPPLRSPLLQNGLLDTLLALLQGPWREGDESDSDDGEGGEGEGRRARAAEAAGGWVRQGGWRTLPPPEECTPTSVTARLGLGLWLGLGLGLGVRR